VKLAMYALVAACLSPLAPSPAWGQEDGAAQPPAPVVRAALGSDEEKVELRYRPVEGSTVTYQLTWTFDLDIPFFGKKHLDGGGLLELTAVAPDEDGLPRVKALLSDLRTMMGGETFVLQGPPNGLSLTLDPLRSVLDVADDAGATGMAAALLKAFYAVRFPARRLASGSRWSHDVPKVGELFIGVREPSNVADPPSGSAVDRVLPGVDEDATGGRARHILAARPMLGDRRLAAVISEIPIDLDLASIPVGVAGSLGNVMQSEIFEDSGAHRWARAPGAGRLKTLAVASIPIEAAITVALVDPATGAPAEALEEYEAPVVPEGEPDVEPVLPERTDPSRPDERLPEDHPLSGR